FRRWRLIRIFKTGEPSIYIRSRSMESFWKSGVAESSRYFFHFCYKTPRFCRTSLNTFFDLLWKSRFLVAPALKQFFPDTKRLRGSNNGREKGDGTFRIRGITHL